MKEWTVSDITDGKYLGIMEFRDGKGEYHYFDIFQTENKLVFGGTCNCGFIESGYMEIDANFSIDENLAELLTDLECYYNDGPEYTTNIVYNQRM